MPITLRPMKATFEDYQYMQAWFAEPELQQWVWCDEKGEPPVSLERIAEKYGTRAQNPTDVFPYFILHAGEPIGFIQYYLHSDEAIGLDMWIGVPETRSRGYGAEALRQMVGLIRRKHPNIKEVFIDPEKENHRAVRCYQKAGFLPECEFTGEEGAACLLMKIHLIRRKNHEAPHPPAPCPAPVHPRRAGGERGLFPVHQGHPRPGGGLRPGHGRVQRAGPGGRRREVLRPRRQ